MKRLFVRRLPMLAAGIAVAAFAAGCTLSVVESRPTGPLDPQALALAEETQPPCRSTLGSYTLPKSVFKFTITKKADENFHVLNQVNAVPTPDSRHVFCLDHLRSAFADDEIKVFKSKITRVDGPPRSATAGAEATPYLQLVASKAVDHTAAIVRNFIKVAFIAISNKGDFSAARSTLGTGAGADQPIVVADFQVDPFDYQEMAHVNAATRPLGFCFVLEDHTFDRAIRGDANAYCNAPIIVAKKHPPKTARAIAQMRYLGPKPMSGIFFRPRASYRLTVYVKPDPSGPGSWRPGLMKNYEFENIMPIVSVGVDRAVFTARRTGLIFNDGMLRNVCIAKGSEVLGGLAIPLEIIYGLIALPTAMLQASANADDLQRQLVERKARLVSAQNAYIKFLSRENDKKEGIPTTGLQSTGLKLGAAADNPTSVDPTSLDAINTAIKKDIEENTIDPITSATGDDPLADICAELMAANTGSGKTARTF